MGFIKEFREFALKGNMMDMAVGIIIGGAFGGIINSLIKDIIMPVIGMFGNVDFSNLYFGLNEKARTAAAAAAEAAKADPSGKTPLLALDKAREFGPVLAYGNFITIFINFLILAFALFLVIKAMNTAKKRFEKEQAAAPAVPPPPPEDVVLLREIRDALRAR
jgi:large conductance mechanosensitive channel